MQVEILQDVTVAVDGIGIQTVSFKAGEVVDLMDGVAGDLIRGKLACEPGKRRETRQAPGAPENKDLGAAPEDKESAGATEGSPASQVEPEPAAPPEGDAREAAVVQALRDMHEDGNADEFTAAGIPSVEALEKRLGFDVTADERTRGWEQVVALRHQG